MWYFPSTHEFMKKILTGHVHYEQSLIITYEFRIISINLNVEKT